MANPEHQQLRQDFINEVKSRLLGPMSPTEELHERPDKRYLTGMVFPRGAKATAAIADEEDIPDDASADPEESGLESPTDLLFQRLPASVGLTFALAPSEHRIRVEVGGACYSRGKSEIVAEEEHSTRRKSHSANVWKRKRLPEDDDPSHVEFDIVGEGRQR